MMKKINPTKQHSMKCPKLYGKKCTCDGYHTFDELYEHRITLFIALCKIIYNDPQYQTGPLSEIWRSKLHSDGTCLEGWFILGIGKIEGKQITYHLPISKWEETNFAQELGNAPKFDGHTNDDVLQRLSNFIINLIR